MPTLPIISSKSSPGSSSSSNAKIKHAEHNKNSTQCSSLPAIANSKAGSLQVPAKPAVVFEGKHRKMCEDIASGINPEKFINNRWMPKSTIDEVYSSYIQKLELFPGDLFEDLIESTLNRLRLQDGFTHSRAAYVLQWQASKVQKIFASYRDNQCKLAACYIIYVSKPRTNRFYYHDILDVHIRNAGKVPRGRMPIIDEIAKAEAQAAILARSLSGLGFAKVGSFAKFMEPYTRSTMQRYCVPHWETATIPFDHHAYNKLYREMCAGKVRQGDKQDLRRMLRKIDFAGHLYSFITTFGAMSDDGNFILTVNEEMSYIYS